MKKISKENQKRISRVEEEYSLLRRKYKLPTFEHFSREFEIKRINPEKCRVFLQAILHLVLARINYLAGIIDSPLNPNPYSYHSLTECSCMTEKDKETITAQYKRLCLWLHKGIAVEFESESTIADYINNLWKEWPSLIKEEKHIAGRFAEIWGMKSHDKHKKA